MKVSVFGQCYSIDYLLWRWLRLLGTLLDMLARRGVLIYCMQCFFTRRLILVCVIVSTWCWRNGFLQPVLKHGPRSLAWKRALGWQTRARNESEYYLNVIEVGTLLFIVLCTIDRSCASVQDLSMSFYAGTRKMVNYAWSGRSQGKPWWRLEGVLTCKSILRVAYRGERLIEPSSSWFPPKFPLG